MVQIFAIGWVLAAAAASVHVLLRYERAASAVAWLFAFWTLPIGGPLLYLLIAMYREPRAIRLRRERAANLRVGRRDGSMAGAPYPDGFERTRAARVAEATAAFPLVAGNRVEILPTGDAAFRAMEEAISGAKKEICLLTYILGDGKVAERLLAALAERAAAGVAVRVLYDEFGSIGLSRAYVERLRSRGVRVSGFLKPSLIKRRFQLQFRNHRKLLVVDGAVAFTGGQNWSDEYGESTAPARVMRDLRVRVDGPVCAALRRVFFEDWCVATEQQADPPLPPPPPHPGALAVRVVPHGPDEENDRLYAMIVAAIHSARAEIFLVTPYFVPSGSLREALRLAATAGIAVRILMPRRSDNPMADLAARRQIAPLVDAGAEVRLHEGTLLHAKALVVDRLWCTIGSANFDYRSFHCNYELNLEIVDAAFAESLLAHFRPEFDAARPIDPALYRRRSAWIRALQNAASLLESYL